jgi:hypothetical protein
MYVDKIMTIRMRYREVDTQQPERAVRRITKDIITNSVEPPDTQGAIEGVKMLSPLK